MGKLNDKWMRVCDGWWPNKSDSPISNTTYPTLPYPTITLACSLSASMHSTSRPNSLAASLFPLRALVAAAPPNSRSMTRASPPRERIDGSPREAWNARTVDRPLDSKRGVVPGIASIPVRSLRGGRGGGG